MASRLVSDMRLAGLQLGLSATSMLMRGAVGLYDAMQTQQAEEEAEEEQAEEEEEENIGEDVDEINSSPPITVNSSSGSSNEQDVDINDAWMRRSSRSRSSDATPDREYPKKK